ncbi:hypothetical protein Tco_0033416, partial [Tanacetum coccineum]
YVVPTGRVVVPTGRYVVPAGKVIIIVSTGSDNDSDDASAHSEATIPQQQQNIQPQIITTVSNNNAKFPYLKKDEYEVWAMKMEYWITNNDMNIWKLQPRNTCCKAGNQRKELYTLLQSIPDDHVAIPLYDDFSGFMEWQSKLDLSQLNQLKAKPEDEDINLSFSQTFPSSMVLRSTNYTSSTYTVPSNPNPPQNYGLTDLRPTFARKNAAKGGNDKQDIPQSRFRRMEKKEEDSNALITVDQMVDWTGAMMVRVMEYCSKEFGILLVEILRMQLNSKSYCSPEDQNIENVNYDNSPNTEKIGIIYRESGLKRRKLRQFYYDLVMSDSDESGVTYTEVSSLFEDLLDIGSPRANDHEYLELPWMPEDLYVEAALQAPPSLDYVPGPKEPEQAPPSPDYVPGPKHIDDEIVAEDQTGDEDASPTAQSPDYVPESDPEADSEDDDDEEPEEDPVDYPADGGDDEDDEEGSSKDDEDDDMDIEADDEGEEEQHLAPADSVVSADTPPPHPAYRVTTRISIPALVPTPLWSDVEVARLLAISTPPSSPLSSWSSPLPQIPSPSLPLSPPSLVLSPAPPPSPIRSLGYRAAMIRMRAEAASTSYSLQLPPPFILSPTRPDTSSLGIPPPLPISVPTSSPPLLLPSASRREDRPKVTLPPRKRLGIALGPGYEVGESSSAAAARPAGGLREDYGFVATIDREIRRDPEREVGYGITDSRDEIVETLQGEPVSTDTELG